MLYKQFLSLIHALVQVPLLMAAIADWYQARDSFSGSAPENDLTDDIMGFYILSIISIANTHFSLNLHFSGFSLKFTSWLRTKIVSFNYIHYSSLKVVVCFQAKLYPHLELWNLTVFWSYQCFTANIYIKTGTNFIAAKLANHTFNIHKSALQGSWLY